MQGLKKEASLEEELSAVVEGKGAIRGRRIR